MEKKIEIVRETATATEEKKMEKKIVKALLKDTLHGDDPTLFDIPANQETVLGEYESIADAEAAKREAIESFLDESGLDPIEDEEYNENGAFARVNWEEGTAKMVDIEPDELEIRVWIEG